MQLAIILSPHLGPLLDWTCCFKFDNTYWIHWRSSAIFSFCVHHVSDLAVFGVFELAIFIKIPVLSPVPIDINIIHVMSDKPCALTEEKGRAAINSLAPIQKALDGLERVCTGG